MNLDVTQQYLNKILKNVKELISKKISTLTENSVVLMMHFVNMLIAKMKFIIIPISIN